MTQDVLKQSGKDDGVFETLDPSEAQRLVANPDISAWVSASAGTGKTKVLTDRVLRLLLPREDGSRGASPHKILCLTFTKAGAGEMALRVNKKLGRWAVLPDEDLNHEMADLLGRAPTGKEREEARKLFAAVVDTPGGLKIMTIHSFCQSVLSRFPLEAGLQPHFTAMDEAVANALLGQARDIVLVRANKNRESPEGKALTAIAAEQNDSQFTSLIRDLCGERHQLEKLLDIYGDVEGIYRVIYETLNVEPGTDEKTILLAGCADQAFHEDRLRHVCAALAEGTLKTDQPKGIKLQEWLDAEPEDRMAAYDSYRSLFLTGKNEPRKNQMTAGLQKKHPGYEELMQQEAERVLQLDERRNAALCAQLTCSLIVIGYAILHEYKTLKDQRAALDFDDMINRTLSLLQMPNNMPGWVLYKLDGGLDHILIDEAQDTNPEQWGIIKILCNEFFAGAGLRDDTTRTFFTVGDRKQSIFSFQRAAPEKFEAMQRYFAERVQQVQGGWLNLPLLTSFRSTPSVLDFVDRVFCEESVRKGVESAPLKHYSHRKDSPGLVELWPLFTTGKSEKADPWHVPLKPTNNSNSSTLLAEHIADTLQDWFERKEVLASKGRPLDAGDIMILVRRRSAFVTQMIRALKTRNIPVSGIDRMVLKDQLAVQDIMACAQFALLPEDDLTLACVLKSPFIGWTDEDLEKIAPHRKTSLWEVLLRSGDDENKTLNWLQFLRQRSGQDHPYEFFSDILQRPCPADSVSGLHAMTSRLGEEAIDPLDELLNMALGFEADHIPALQGFLLWQIQGDTQIKREQEQAGGKVRIMTVHASKGLQAPVVILPDTVRAGRTAGSNSDHRLLWPDKSEVPVPLWSPRKEYDCKLYRKALHQIEDRLDEEYRRLLYVAMTRAEDRLYIGGYKGRTAHEESWYFYMKQAFSHFPDKETLSFETSNNKLTSEGGEEQDMSQDTLVYRISNGSPQALSDFVAGDSAVLEKEIDLADSSCDWLFTAPAAEPDPPQPLIPSRPSVSEEPPVASPLSSSHLHRFKRGTMTHKLLQILPDLSPEKRRRAATAFVAQPGHGLPEEIQTDIVKEIMAILEDEAYAPLFGPGSLAEVPVTGLMGSNLVSGEIDRLLVTDDAVWIVDYKTNRPPPQKEEAIPEQYKFQMKSYSDIVAKIYPGRSIRSFLLWTDGPRLMELRDL